VIILALTSKTRTPGQIFDAVSNIVLQRLSQVTGVGDVELGGSSLPAVRVELNPYALNHLWPVDGRRARRHPGHQRQSSARRDLQGNGRRLQIYSESANASGGRSAADYRNLVVGWRNGTAIRLQDVAEVVDGVEDQNNLGLFNGQPAIIVLLRQAGANVIETVDSVRAQLPQLQAQLPPDVKIEVASRQHQFDPLVAARNRSDADHFHPAGGAGGERVPAQRARHHRAGGGDRGVAAGHLRRDVPAGLQPEQPVADGADRGHRLRGRRRHRGAGKYHAPHRGRHGPLRAALLGAREVGFTVLSISLSLIAVFIPLLFMGGQFGALVQGIRRHAVGCRDDFAGDLADHHADDVRLAAEAGPCPGTSRPDVSRVLRTRLRQCTEGLRA
jgi:multidrug efflux pump